MAVLKGKALLKKAFLALLLMFGVGGLIYAALPEAYCNLEDKTVKYIYMSDSHKTVTKVVPFTDDDGNTNFNILDDRCQKGTTIGQWIPINKVLSTDFEDLKNDFKELNDNYETLKSNHIELQNQCNLEKTCTPAVVYSDIGGVYTKFFCDCLEKGQNAICTPAEDIVLPIY